MSQSICNDFESWQILACETQKSNVKMDLVKVIHDPDFYILSIGGLIVAQLGKYQKKQSDINKFNNVTLPY